MCQSKQYFLGQISKPVNLFKPRFNFQPFWEFQVRKAGSQNGWKSAGNQAQFKPYWYQKQQMKLFFSFHGLFLKLQKSDDDDKLNLMHCSSLPLSHLLVESPVLGHTFLLEIWLLVSPPPPPCNFQQLLGMSMGLAGSWLLVVVSEKRESKRKNEGGPSP